MQGKISHFLKNNLESREMKNGPQAERFRVGGEKGFLYRFISLLEFSETAAENRDTKASFHK